jgi:hypothetical protein
MQMMSVRWVPHHALHIKMVKASHTFLFKWTFELWCIVFSQKKKKRNCGALCVVKKKKKKEQCLWFRYECDGPFCMVQFELLFVLAVGGNDVNKWLRVKIYR